MKSKLYKAISLVETIVYLGTFAALSSSVIMFFNLSNEHRNVNEAKVDVYNASIFIEQVLYEDISTANSIDVSNSTFGTQSDVLVVVMHDDPQISYTYNLSNSTLVVNDSAGVANLSSSNVKINQFNVNSIQNSNLDEVGLEFNIIISSAKQADITETLSFVIYLEELV